MNNLILMTGTPGSGKTTLLESLQEIGFPFVSEPARPILESDPIYAQEPKKFVEKLLEKSIENYQLALEDGRRVFFDRGIPDLIAYAKWFKLETSEIEKACREFRYNQKVFLFRPWKEIYKNDEMRTMTFDEALLFHEYLKEGYEVAGYDLVDVPLGSLKERRDLIILETRNI